MGDVLPDGCPRSWERAASIIQPERGRSSLREPFPHVMLHRHRALLRRLEAPSSQAAHLCVLQGVR